MPFNILEFSFLNSKEDNLDYLYKPFDCNSSEFEARYKAKNVLNFIRMTHFMRERMLILSD